MKTELDPKTMENALGQLRHGTDPSTVLNFVYCLGVTDGMLEMAKNSTDALIDGLRKAA